MLWHNILSCVLNRQQSFSCGSSIKKVLKVACFFFFFSLSSLPFYSECRLLLHFFQLLSFLPGESADRENKLLFFLTHKVFSPTEESAVLPGSAAARRPHKTSTHGWSPGPLASRRQKNEWAISSAQLLHLPCSLPLLQKVSGSKSQITSGTRASRPAKKL